MTWLIFLSTWRSQFHVTSHNNKHRAQHSVVVRCSQALNSLLYDRQHSRNNCVPSFYDSRQFMSWIFQVCNGLKPTCHFKIFANIITNEKLLWYVFRLLKRLFKLKWFPSYTVASWITISQLDLTNKTQLLHIQEIFSCFYFSLVSGLSLCENSLSLDRKPNVWNCF